QELEKELRFHLDEQVKEHLDEGLSPEEARRRARMDFGGVHQIKEACRDIRPAHRLSRVMDGLRRDVRDAVRSLVRQPGFTAATLLTLMIAIGASTAVFSVVYGVLLRPLPY